MSFAPRPRAPRTVLVEPQKLFVSHLVKALESTGLDVVATVPNLDYVKMRALDPDIVVIDSDWVADPLEVWVGELRASAPHARIIAYVGESDSAAMRLRSFGVEGVLTRDSVFEDLKTTVATVMLPARALSWQQFRS